MRLTTTTERAATSGRVRTRFICNLPGTMVSYADPGMQQALPPQVARKTGVFCANVSATTSTLSKIRDRGRGRPSREVSAGVIEPSSEPSFCSTLARFRPERCSNLCRERPAKFCGKRCGASISVNCRAEKIFEGACGLFWTECG